MTLGSNIKSLLRKNNISQKELAKRINTTEITVSRYINDKRQPNADKLASIAEVLNTSTDNLLGRRTLDNKEVFYQIHRLILESAGEMSHEEKNKLIKAILDIRENG